MKINPICHIFEEIVLNIDLIIYQSLIDLNSHEISIISLIILKIITSELYHKTTIHLMKLVES